MNDGAPLPPLWIRAAVKAESFEHEQAAFAKTWSFVGLATDIPDDGDWFSTTVGRRSIFVQRFGNELRSFENRCAHRFYPLRRKAKGKGPVVCDFHHWRYNKDGKAVGIPMCPALYDGAIPRDLDLGITRLDLECCGELIFVRFPGDAPQETLREFLSDGYSIIEALTTHQKKAVRFNLAVSANWKFSHHISFDDYHNVAIHPKTFGKNGYLKPNRVKYHRFGKHSAFLATDRDEAWDDLKKLSVGGRYDTAQYTILNLFPNTIVSLTKAVRLFGSDNWHVIIARYVAVSQTESQTQVWMFKAPFEVEETALSRFLAPLADRIIAPIAARVARKIMGEDNFVCEGQQLNAHQVDGDQKLSAYEKRIGWFEEAYKKTLEPEAR